MALNASAFCFLTSFLQVPSSFFPCLPSFLSLSFGLNGYLFAFSAPRRLNFCLE
ncbi:hypothetical protein M405DRAFT_818582 [Rhizopogon salebrosus TDB-379]|nr:hypothetical protein M405DRAFT_818582 [Rhizopogon salebrosus TDB-379]